jgi:ABC-type amino acid transport substrate-binding protein/CheY-like chemotaxis protein/anti-sigma regulatory factor (Ser/Thr protein kinase)
MATKSDMRPAGGVRRPSRRGGGVSRLLVLLALLLALGGAAADVAARPLVFYGDRALVPYEFAGPNGEPAGASVDLARALGRVLDRPVEIRLAELGEAQAKVLGGEGDALLSLSPTRGRQPLFDFSSPTLPAPFGLFALAAARDRLAARELNKLIIGVTASGYAQGYFTEHHPDMAPVVVADTADGIARLLRGEIDMFAGPAWVVGAHLEQGGIGGVVRFSTFSQRFTAFAVREGDAATLAELDRGLELLKASGEYDRIVERWAPAPPHQLSGRQYHALWGLMILALVATVGLGVAAAVSRREGRRLAAEVAHRMAVEADLQAIMDAAPAAIWIARDPDGQVIEGNRASSEMLRVGPGSNISKSAIETGHLRFAVHDAQGRELPPENLPVQRAARGEHVYGCELMLRFDDGDTVYEYGNAVPLLGPDGAVKGAVAAFIDISRLKQTEAALRIAKIEAERANDAKSRFLAAASHDLRQPLQALGFYLGTLEERLGGGEKALMTPIKVCLGSLRALLDDLLDLGRLDAGVLAPKPGPVSVADLLLRIRAAHGPAAAAKGLRLRMAGARPVVEADAVLLERMVGNLVSNAIRYTERGGVLVGCRRGGGKWRIEVWDTGIGIPAGRTAEIFEEFVQLDNPERGREKGAGLGLAIVRRLAGLTGCGIEVRSRPGRGSLFRIVLPGPSMLPGAPAEVPAAGGRSALRVALIEDDATVRDALACAIGAWGHEVRAASSPDEVMAELGDGAPDLVISDYRLPGGETGLTAVARLRSAFGGGLAAVILTGETAPDVVREIAGQGIEIRHKPLDFDELRACLDSYAVSSAV